MRSMKVYERIFENKLRYRIKEKIEENQDGFCPGKGIFSLRQIGEKVLLKVDRLYICAIDMEKAFDRLLKK